MPFDCFVLLPSPSTPASTSTFFNLNLFFCFLFVSRSALRFQCASPRREQNPFSAPLETTSECALHCFDPQCTVPATLRSRDTRRSQCRARVAWEAAERRAGINCRISCSVKSHVINHRDSHRPSDRAARKSSISRWMSGRAIDSFLRRNCGSRWIVFPSAMQRQGAFCGCEPLTLMRS